MGGPLSAQWCPHLSLPPILANPNCPQVWLASCPSSSSTSSSWWGLRWWLRWSSGSPGVSLGFLCRHWWDIGQGCWWNQSRINVSIMSGRGQWLPVGALSAPRGQGRTTGPPTDRHYGGSLPSSWATSRATTAITAASYWGHRVVHEVPKPLGYSHLLLGNSVGPRGCRPESSKVPQHGSSYLVLTDS